MADLRRRPALLVAVAVFLIGALTLEVTQRDPPLPLPRVQAIGAALGSPETAKSLLGVRWNTASVTRLDANFDRVSFFEGGQIVAQVAVRRDGVVTQGESFTARSVPYGDWIAYEPALLIGLSALFVLMAGVAPWRRLRNLDVAATLSLVAPMVLLQKRYIDASVLSAVPGLGYLLARCALMALGSAPRPHPATPLLDVLSAAWDVRRRVRLLRVLAFVLALVFVMVTVASQDPVDVTYAVMEGATKLIGGLLPYGHMPGDVIHGDTYPLLSYALYTPLAWISPVQSTWSSVDAALGASVAAVLGVFFMLFRSAAGVRLSGRWRRAPEQELAGLRAALTWLTFPPLLAVASTGTTDVVLAGMLLLAVLLWRQPSRAAGLLAVGAWFKLAPLALLPVQLAPLRGRRLARALGAIVLVSIPMLALLIALGGSGGPAAMLHAMSYQLLRGSPQSLWSALGIEPIQAIAEAAALALIAGAAVRLHARPDWHRDTRRMAALAGAILIALQLAANYWAFLYLVWVVPLVSLSLLSDPSPVVASVSADVAGRRLRAPEPELAGVS
jgi:hypothetical protein